MDNNSYTNKNIPNNIDKISKEAKELITILEEIKHKTDINNNCLLLKYLDRVSIAKFIIPYLELNDIINFRSTCKDINSAVSSTVAMVSYYKVVNNRKKGGNVPNMNAMMKPFGELNDTDDIEAELESLKNVSLYIYFNLIDKGFSYTKTISIRVNN